ncbi:hypothetical protein TWF970_011492 [Orbilia oligospora]|uniref:Uncharacterized protein n=1 Tax=Orbilia oligospora TaxID=2813651 RepID=A0A7C8RCG4_ORBOL|nr:hypothetical protein TWF970_011492 [Orbilia oligospora]
MSIFTVSALFEVAVLEHFLRPPINYETAENPYACNDVPPTEHGVVSYFLIRKTNVHPRVIALYRSSDPFTTACTEANLKSIVSFFPEANTQQVVVPPPGGFITHWKALSTISPEWNLYTEYMTQPGQKLMRSSMPPYEWLDIHSAVSVQDYEYDWEDIANRRRGYWGANDLYPPSPHSSDDEDDDDESSDWEDSGYQTSDANDFEFETESIENCSGDAAWAGRRGGEDKRNLYDMVIEFTPQRWPMEEEPPPNPNPGQNLNPNPQGSPQRLNLNPQSSPQRLNPNSQNPPARPNLNSQNSPVRPNPNIERRPEGVLVRQRPAGNYVPLYEPGHFTAVEQVLRAQARNRAIQRAGTYIPLARVDQVRPRGVLLSQGFFIDPEKEDAELGRDRDARELEEEVGDSFGQIQEIDMNRGDSELSGRLRSVQESPMTVFEEEGNPEREYPVQAGVQPPGGIPQINNNHQPPVQDISPFLGYQPGGYTGDVDKFFDFR